MRAIFEKALCDVIIVFAQLCFNCVLIVEKVGGHIEH